MPDRHLKSTLDRIARGVEALVNRNSWPPPEAKGYTFDAATGIVSRSFPPTPTFWQSYLAAADRAGELEKMRAQAKAALKSAGWKQWMLPENTYPLPTSPCFFCSSRWLDPITNGRFSFDDAARLQAQRSGG